MISPRTLAQVVIALLVAIALVQPAVVRAQGGGARSPDVTSLSFRGTEYVHRWSKDGQSEFTPRSEIDLKRWNDMVTINVHPKAVTGEQLAEIANRTLANYERYGKILRTESRPRTADRPAEHLIVAVLGDPNFLEAAFARFALVDGVGYVTVYSHRVYSKGAGPAMSEWLQQQGTQVERALLEWQSLPRVAELKRLPQGK